MLEDSNKDKIIAIITYCDTKRKIDVLIDNINLIREKYSNFKIAIQANYPLPEYVQRMVDLYFYQDLNYRYEKFANAWRILPHFDRKFIYHFYDSYEYSVFQMINAVAKHLIEYKRVLLMNYDLILEREHIEHTDLENDLITYEWGSTGFSLILMNFNPLIFYNQITKFFTIEKHMELKEQIAEEIFCHYVKNSDINYELMPMGTADSIKNMPYYAFENEYFNENLVCFNNNILEIYLWHLKTDIRKIKVKIDDDEYLLFNQNRNGGFENIFSYNKKIENIKIIQINDNDAEVPLTILYYAETQKLNENKMKLRLVHILNRTDGEREINSINSLSKVQDIGIEYIQQITPLYDGDEWEKTPPITSYPHGKGHYGLYLNYKKVMKEYFSDDLDALIVCECDCVLDIPIQDFLNEIKNTLDFSKKYDVYQFSWGGRIVNGVEQGEVCLIDNNYPNYCIVSKIIQTHFIILTKQSRNFFLNKIDNFGWDTADIWFNEMIFSEFDESGRQATVFKKLAYQYEGLSTIDVNELKGEKKTTIESQDLIIDINLEENKIYIITKKNCNNIKAEILEWNPYQNTENLLYTNSYNYISNDTKYWLATNDKMKEKYGIKVKIYQNNLLIKEEKFKLKSRNGIKIKNQVVIIYAECGMGDNMLCTPTIRKLYNVYNRKIKLYTYFPEVFINNPYLEEVIKLNNPNDIENIKLDENEYEIHRIAHSYYMPFNIIYRWVTNDDVMNIFAKQTGLILRNSDKDLDFFPDECEIPNLPEKYVVLNTNVTHKSRTWGSNNWNELIKLLEKEQIFVVALGSKASYAEKSFLDNISITYGLNLQGKTSLSEAWHIINGAKCIVTHNSGMYMIAMSTDTNIIELGSNIDYTNWRIRKNIWNYKHSYVLGECDLHCISDSSNHVSINGTVNSLLPMQECCLNYPTFKCHPTPEQVFEEIIKTI